MSQRQAAKALGVRHARGVVTVIRDDDDDNDDAGDAGARSYAVLTSDSCANDKRGLSRRSAVCTFRSLACRRYHPASARSDRNSASFASKR